MALLVGLFFLCFLTPPGGPSAAVSVVLFFVCLVTRPDEPLAAVFPVLFLVLVLGVFAVDLDATSKSVSAADSTVSRGRDDRVRDGRVGAATALSA